MKRSDSKGDLYLRVKVDFPEEGWLTSEPDLATLQNLLPPPAPPIEAQEIDEVEYEDDAEIEEVSLRRYSSPFLSDCRADPIPYQMGAQSGDPRANAWEDEEEAGGGAQCAQQ